MTGRASESSTSVLRTELPAIQWAIAAFGAANLALVAWQLPGFTVGIDWVVWEGAVDGSPYAGGAIPFVWSPVAAWLLVPVVAVGFWPWVAAHLAALVLLRDRLLIGLALVSWAFWADALVGSVTTFVFVAAVLAVRGSQMAGLVFLALAILIPRPLHLPLAAWLLWRQPELRVPFAVMFTAHALLVAWSGLGPEWIAALASFDPGWDKGPTAVIGAWWFIVGIPLAAWCLWTARPGWAGLAISPYLLSGYWLMLLVDWPSRGVPSRTRPSSSPRSRC